MELEALNKKLIEFWGNGFYTPFMPAVLCTIIKNVHILLATSIAFMWFCKVSFLLICCKHNELIHIVILAQSVHCLSVLLLSLCILYEKQIDHDWLMLEWKTGDCCWSIDGHVLLPTALSVKSWSLKRLSTVLALMFEMTVSLIYKCSLKLFICAHLWHFIDLPSLNFADRVARKNAKKKASLLNYLELKLARLLCDFHQKPVGMEIKLDLYNWNIISMHCSMACL